MPNPAFDHVTHWVFDLDNTLYPPAERLFDQIEVKMTDYMVQLLGIEPTAANELRQQQLLAPSQRAHGAGRYVQEGLLEPGLLVVASNI